MTTMAHTKEVTCGDFAFPTASAPPLFVAEAHVVGAPLYPSTSSTLASDASDSTRLTMPSQRKVFKSVKVVFNGSDLASNLREYPSALRMTNVTKRDYDLLRARIAKLSEGKEVSGKSEYLTYEECSAQARLESACFAVGAHVNTDGLPASNAHSAQGSHTRSSQEELREPLISSGRQARPEPRESPEPRGDHGAEQILKLFVCLSVFVIIAFASISLMADAHDDDYRRLGYDDDYDNQSGSSTAPVAMGGITMLGGAVVAARKNAAKKKIADAIEQEILIHARAAEDQIWEVTEGRAGGCCSDSRRSYVTIMCREVCAEDV
jgi:hypothetical protein